MLLLPAQHAIKQNVKPQLKTNRNENNKQNYPYSYT